LDEKGPIEQMTTQTSITLFMGDREILQNVTPKTLAYYANSFRVVRSHLPADTQDLSTAHIMSIVKACKQDGHATSSINGYLRAVRAWVKWLKEQGECPDRFTVQMLREEQMLMPTFTNDQLRALLAAKPRSIDHQRVQVMLTVACDTGVRITELLNLKREDVDWERCTIRVFGKGRKERLVPMSQDCRKVLYRWITRTHPAPDSQWVWATRRGTLLTMRNSYRDLKALAEKCGVKGVRVSWHTFRHTFGTRYAANGGNVLYLQAILGHQDLKTTKRYVRVETETLVNVHNELSAVSALSKPK
jgi:integrase/recombinase XerD